MKLPVFLSNYKQNDDIKRMDIDSIELKEGERNSCHLCKNVAQHFTIVVIADARYIKNAFMILKIGALILNL